MTHPSHLSASSLAQAKTLREDFSQDLFAFISKWQDNLAREGFVHEMGVILAIPLMEACMGQLMGTELASGRHPGYLTSLILSYGGKCARVFAENPAEVIAQVMAELAREQGQHPGH